MLLGTLAGCSSLDKDETPTVAPPVDPGAYIRMYVSEPIYNFDPALAFNNEAALRIVSLMYDNLFVLGENGKPEKSLVKKYEIDKNENSITLTLRTDTYWSDGSPIASKDVFFAWERLLDATKSFEAAALLYDVKNARACKEGDVSIEDVGIELLNDTQIKIHLNENANPDNFILNLTSYALVPLRKDIVGRTEYEIDWAKSPIIMVTSGPFRLRTISYEPETAGLTLERNAYYQRNFLNDKPDKAVTPYRIIVDYTKTGEQIFEAYENGEIFYLGDLPLDVRSTKSLEEWSKYGKVTDAMSTHSYLFNENAVIRYYNAAEFANLKYDQSYFTEKLVEGTDGDKIFANAKVRKALSLALNRSDIANAVVLAEAATGLVPNGVFETSNKNNLFNNNRSTSLSASADLSAASALLAEAGVDPAKYMFAISVPAYDEVHLKIAQMVQAAWTELGFHVAIMPIENVNNADKATSTNATILGIKDDIFAQNYAAGLFEVLPIDYTAFSPSALSVLAPFAKGYTGNASIEPQGTEFTVATHISGYNSEAFNAKIAEAYDTADLEARAKILHEAEAILLEDMPIVPVVYNKNFRVSSNMLSKISYSYYGYAIFTKTKLKNYKDYVPSEE